MSHLILLKILKYEKEVFYQRGFASFMVFKSFDKKSSAGGATTLANKSAIKNKNMPNQ